MKRKPDVLPTKTELDVLQILWEYGPSTVRFVHDKLNEHKEAVIYTSTLKLMQGMKEKGMLTRDESEMKHVYAAALKEDKTKKGMLEHFVDTIYNGSLSKAFMALLGNDNTSQEELEKIKELINQRSSLKKGK